MDKAMSLPMRGAWIEILRLLSDARLCLSLPMRGAWIKINAPGAARIREVSLPRRGAWIEMACSSLPWRNS